MKTRTVTKRKVDPTRSLLCSDTQHWNSISLPLEPWHQPSAEPEHPRPTEPPLYAMHQRFGASTVRGW